MPPLCSRACVAAAAILLSASLDAARAETKTLDSELERVVSLVKKTLGEGQSIHVKPFSDLTEGTDLSGSIKTGLTEAFNEECRRQSLRIDRGARFILQGDFFVTDKSELRAGRPLVLQLDWTLKKRNNQTIVVIAPTRVETRLTVNDPAFLAQAIGLIGVVPQGADNLSAKQIGKMSLNPTGVANEGRVKSGQVSPYEVEIRSRPAGALSAFQPLPAKLVDGLPFIDIPFDHEYQIWIYNHSTEPVAVAPSIDGLSTFHFADEAYHDATTGKLTRKHYILSAAPSGAQPYVGLIRGWHLSDSGPNNVGRFLVTNYGDSAASRIGVSEDADAGAIHLQFCRCKPSASETKTRSITGKGTDLGVRETVKFATSTLLPGEPVEFLTIRYSR